jgi:hypothetical protein
MVDLKYPFVYVVVPGNKKGERIGIVELGESGYYVTNLDNHETAEECREHVRLINESRGIPLEVETSMRDGSMFGWHCPAAQPAVEFFKKIRRRQMRKFKVRMTITAACEYEVEVEGSSESNAEDAASALWREKLPDDFQVAKGYITDWDAETTQLTWECGSCEKEISEAEYRANDEMCVACEAADRVRNGS